MPTYIYTMKEQICHKSILNFSLFPYAIYIFDEITTLIYQSMCVTVCIGQISYTHPLGLEPMTLSSIPV